MKVITPSNVTLGGNMSRTYRQPINSKFFSGYTSQLELYHSKIKSRLYYEKACHLYDGFLGSKYACYIAFRANQTDEELFEESLIEFSKQTRDGRNGMTATSMRSGFKHEAARYIRRRNNDVCKHILQGNYDYDESYPDRKHAKYLMWNWW